MWCLVIRSTKIIIKKHILILKFSFKHLNHSLKYLCKDFRAQICKALKNKRGLPQGRFLGLALFCIFFNELTVTV